MYASRNISTIDYAIRLNSVNYENRKKSQFFRNYENRKVLKNCDFTR
jgi:hypothetical protein